MTFVPRDSCYSHKFSLKTNQIVKSNFDFVLRGNDWVYHINKTPPSTQSSKHRTYSETLLKNGVLFIKN